MSFKHKCSGYLKEYAIFPFSNTILLGCVRASGLMYKAILREKRFYVSINIFYTIIGQKNSRLSLKLSTNHVVKINKNTEYLRFVLKKVDPTHPCTIINKQNIIRELIRRRLRSRTPNIRMKKHKRFSNLIKTTRI